jgi:hypothetical protein
MAVNSSMNNPDPGTHPAAAVDPAAAAALDRATLELARNIDREPSPELLPAVMQTVWAELRPGQRIPLPGSHGTLFITETAAGNALVAHIDGLAGIIVRRCTVVYRAPNTTRGGTPPSVRDSPGADSGGIGITLTAAVAYGTGTDALLARVRSVIGITAQDLFGLTVDQVDIDIVDVYPPAGHLR